MCLDLSPFTELHTGSCTETCARISNIQGFSELLGGTIFMRTAYSTKYTLSCNG